MSVAVCYTRAQMGIDAPLVTVEVHLSQGNSAFQIVGLAEAALRESRERVRSALMNCGYEFPNQQRITVNLAPADLPKDGGRYDLAIALGILKATEQLSTKDLSHYEFLGELSLKGELRSVSGALPSAIACSKTSRPLILPVQDAEDAAFIPGLEALPADHLKTVIAHLESPSLKPATPTFKLNNMMEGAPDFSEVRGQQTAKRALEIAAAGGHSILMSGPPGTGKSMLSERFPSILPPLEPEEALSVASIYSLTMHSNHDWRQGLRPFRAPHHSATSPAVLGGGRHPKPGEISLAHQGVLFLDEFPEFSQVILESLREPLESGVITISRMAQQVTFPAQFQLIAAMNPCPCGYLTHPHKQCVCHPDQVTRYRRKISGPIMDRLDCQIEVPYLSPRQLTSIPAALETSSDIRERVIQARQIQIQRQQCANAQLSTNTLKAQTALDSKTQEEFLGLTESMHLSARTYTRLLKLARTIADLSGSHEITLDYLMEALSLRELDSTPVVY